MEEYNGDCCETGLAGCTLINLSNGCSQPAEFFEGSELAIGFNEAARALENYSMARGARYQVEGRTIKLCMEDGQTITCRREQQFLLDDGSWEEAKNLKGQWVVAGLEYPEDSSCEKERHWRIDSSSLTLNMFTCREKVLAFSRIMGYVLTGGREYFSRKRREKVIKAKFPSRIDALNFKDDVVKFSCVDVKINKKGGSFNCEEDITYSIILPDKIFETIHSLENGVAGKRPPWAGKLPEFILNEECPMAVAREFLGGLFGGGGDGLRLFGGKFTTISFKWRGKGSDMTTAFENILALLKKFDIECGEFFSHKIKAKYGKKNTGTYFYLNVARDSCPDFSKKVGVRYRTDMSCRLTIVSLYHRLCAKVKRERTIISRAHKKFLRERASMDDCMSEARKIFLKKEFTASSALSVSAESISNSGIWFDGSPSELSFLRESRATNWFVKNSHAVKGENLTVPVFRRKVVEIMDSDPVAAYSVGDKTDNFIAHGVVSHNNCKCPVESLL